ncbi:MAG: hypothetical protein ACJ8HI_00255 [Massilia sp.]
MSELIYLRTRSYSPAQLLDTMRQQLALDNDAALARELDIQAPLLSKIRNGKLPVSAGLLIRMHEASGLAIEELRGLMGDRRSRFRICARSRALSMRQGAKARPATSTRAARSGQTTW